MIRYCVIALMLISFNAYSVSKQETIHIYQKIIKAGGFYWTVPKLYFSDDPDVFARINSKGIFISARLIKKLNSDETALILGHELGHLRTSNELRADELGFYYAIKAGYNGCSASSVFRLMYQGKTSTHPEPKIRRHRLEQLCRKN